MDIQYIVIHCSATKAGREFTAADIRRWHLEKGWSDIGYHYVIRRDGILEYGRNHETPGAHVKGYNNVSLGICLVGGLDESGDPENNFTPEQFDTLKDLLSGLKYDYPSAIIQGHRDFPGVTKACPCFDVKEWLIKENLQ